VYLNSHHVLPHGRLRPNEQTILVAPSTYVSRLESWSRTSHGDVEANKCSLRSCSTGSYDLKFSCGASVCFLLLREDRVFVNKALN
jgi:hypothetical protein